MAKFEEFIYKTAEYIGNYIAEGMQPLIDAVQDFFSTSPASFVSESPTQYTNGNSEPNQAPTTLTQDSINKEFDKHDRNGNGKLSISELNMMKQTMQSEHQSTNSEIKIAENSFKKHINPLRGDFSIDRQEFTQIAHDLVNKGIITEDQMREASAPSTSATMAGNSSNISNQNSRE